MKKNGLLKDKEIQLIKEEDILNLIYYMIEELNLVYKPVEMLRVF